MKKIILFVLVALLISGCSQVKESLYDAVDPQDNTQIEIQVTSGMTPGELGSLLSENNLVSNSLAFTNYLKERSLDGSLQEGKFLLSPSMNMEELVDTLITPVESDTIILTIPEGYEVRNIVELLKSENMIDENRFYELLEKGDFPYEFLKGLDRSHHLEGFLFPDTYEFYIDATEEEIIDKFLANFDSKFQDKYYTRMKDLSMDLQGLITFASIIEREAADPEERAIISSVFHNRVKDGMMLESCATVQYILKERKPILSYEDMAIESDYNTYINVGLPPAPIANPGLASIEAALYPAETNYLFFVLKGENESTHYFSETFEEHEENILRSQEEDEGDE